MDPVQTLGRARHKLPRCVVEWIARLGDVLHFKRREEDEGEECAGSRPMEGVRVGGGEGAGVGCESGSVRGGEVWREEERRLNSKERGEAGHENGERR